MESSDVTAVSSFFSFFLFFYYKLYTNLQTTWKSRLMNFKVRVRETSSNKILKQF